MVCDRTSWSRPTCVTSDRHGALTASCVTLNRVPAVVVVLHRRPETCTLTCRCRWELVAAVGMREDRRRNSGHLRRVASPRKQVAGTGTSSELQRASLRHDGVRGSARSHCVGNWGRVRTHPVLHQCQHGEYKNLLSTLLVCIWRSFRTRTRTLLYCSSYCSLTNTIGAFETVFLLSCNTSTIHTLLYSVRIFFDVNEYEYLVL